MLHQARPAPPLDKRFLNETSIRSFYFSTGKKKRKEKKTAKFIYEFNWTKLLETSLAVRSFQLFFEFSFSSLFPPLPLLFFFNSTPSSFSFSFPFFFFFEKSHNRHVIILPLDSGTKRKKEKKKKKEFFNAPVHVCYSTHGVDTGSGRTEGNFALQYTTP